MKHPAKYSDDILAAIAKAVEGREWVLDPFAGTGRIHQLENKTIGVEIEPEWANMHPDTIVGNALRLPFPDACFDAVATSPTYGNRMADTYIDKLGKTRFNYTDSLGRKLHEDNSGAMHWGEKYRDFHARAWYEAARVLKDGGILVLNIKDHFRKGVRMEVTEWHIAQLEKIGFQMDRLTRVPSSGVGFGANRDLRTDHEAVITFKW